MADVLKDESSGRVCSPTGTTASIPRDLAESLAEARRTVETGASALQVATALRDDLIGKALEAGGSLRQVAELAGMTHAGVAYIRGRRP